MEIIDLLSYHVKFIQGRGNCMIATRNILSGEHIYDETPLFWSCYKGQDDSNCFCFTCGKYLEECSIPCITGCQIKYCSLLCIEKSANDGHQWLCEAYRPGNMIDKFDTGDYKGHLVLSCSVYAKCAQYVLDMNALNTGESSANPNLAVEAYDSFMSTFLSADFCQSVHSMRSGDFNILNVALFDDMIAPVYFASHLAKSLKSIQSFFLHHPCWNGDSAMALAFAQSEIFSDMNMRLLMGTFLINCHSIQGLLCGNAHTMKGTGLYRTLSKTNHSCVCNTSNGMAASGGGGRAAARYPCSPPRTSLRAKRSPPAICTQTRSPSRARTGPCTWPSTCSAAPVRCACLRRRTSLPKRTTSIGTPLGA